MYPPAVPFTLPLLLTLNIKQYLFGSQKDRVPTIFSRQIGFHKSYLQHKSYLKTNYI